MAPRNKRTPRAGALLPRILQCPRNANSLTCLGRFPPLWCVLARGQPTPQPRSSLPSWAEQSRHCAIHPLDPPSRRARHPGGQGLDPPRRWRWAKWSSGPSHFASFRSAVEGSRASIASSSRIRFPANGSTGTRPSVHMPNQRCWSPAAAPCQPGGMPPLYTYFAH